MRLAQDEGNTEKRLDCDQCDEKFPDLSKLIQHKVSHICPDYKKGQCKFGPRGTNSQGQCQFKHPRTCLYFETPAGCKKKDNCDFLHRVRNHSSANSGNRVFNHGGQRNQSDDQPFLDQGQMMMEILLQLRKLNQDQNNNRGPRTPYWQMRK